MTTRFALKAANPNTLNVYLSKRDHWISPGIQGQAKFARDVRTYQTRERAARAAANCFVDVIVAEITL